MSDRGKNLPSKSRLLSAVAVVPLLTLGVFEPGNVVAAEERPSYALEEITVTARKRTESLQDAPLAIVAFNENLIKQQNIVRLHDINHLAPNLTVETGAGVAGAASVTIRGIGSYDYELYADSPVSFYVDGVLWARPHTINGEMFDLERVEVLYGPQGTLFGRNTTAGAISLHTKQPGEDFSLEQKLGYGSDSEITARTIVNTGAFGGDKFKAKFGYFRHEMDGWQRDLNSSPSTSPGARKSDSLMGQLHGDLSDKLSFDIRADWRTIDYIPTAYQLIDVTDDVINYFNMSPGLGGDPFLYVTEPKILDEVYQDNAVPGSREETWGGSLTVNYSFSPAANLKNIFAYREMDQFTDNNPGGQGFLLGPILDPVTFAPAGIAPVTPLAAVTNNKQHQISNELQLTGEAGRLNYAVGVFYFEESADGSQFTDLTFVLPGGTSALNLQAGRVYALTTKSTAAYGQVSYTPPILDDKLEITGGLRYTHDKKDFFQNIFNGGVPTATQSLEKSWNDVSEIISLNYSWTDEVNTYARYATGYKAGGFNPGTIQDPYNPENVEAFEIGLKSFFWDRRVNLNIAAFHTKYDDLQTTQFIFASDGSQSNAVLNAAKATYTGLEVELAVVPVENLRLDFNLGLVDPKYKSFLITDPVTLMPKDISDTAEFQLMSKTSFRVGAQYDFSFVTVGELTASVDYTYKSKRYWYAVNEFNPRNEIIKGNPANIMTAHINWAEIPLSNTGAMLRIDLHGYNLLDQDRVEAGADLGALGSGFINFARPRSFMAEFTVSL